MNKWKALTKNEEAGVDLGEEQDAGPWIPLPRFSGRRSKGLSTINSSNCHRVGNSWSSQERTLAKSMTCSRDACAPSSHTVISRLWQLGAQE